TGACPPGGLAGGRGCSPRRAAKRAESPCAAKQVSEPRGQCRNNIVLLARKKAGDAAGIKGTRALLLADGAHDNRGQHSEQRSTRALAQPRILANRTGECGLVPAARERREELRSLLDERGLARGTDHVGKAAEGASLLPHGVDEFLRSAGLRGNAAESSQ